MEDAQIHERIEQLVAEEHALYERGSGGGLNEDEDRDRKSTRLNSSHIQKSRMPSSA